MKIHNGKHAWMVKIGEKGQFVIPKEARELFDLQPGDEIIVLGDENSKGETIVAARIYPNFEELSEIHGKTADEFTDEELDEIFKDVVNGVNAKLPPFKKIVNFKIRRTEFVKTTTSKIMRHKNND